MYPTAQGSFSLLSLFALPDLVHRSEMPAMLWAYRKLAGTNLCGV
jgi:hypothetical protein